MSFHQIQIQAVQKTPSEKSQIRENRQTLLGVSIYWEKIYTFEEEFMFELVITTEQNKHMKKQQLLTSRKQKVGSKRKVEVY